MTLNQFPSLLALPVLALCSCGAVKKSGSIGKFNNPIKGLAKMNKNDLLNFKLGDLRTNTPPIIQVRPKDLKKMQTGEERYLAYHREKELYYIGSEDGIEYLPKDFDPSTLPDGTDLPSIGILPPLSPGVDSGVDLEGDLDDLSAPEEPAEESENEE